MSAVAPLSWSFPIADDKGFPTPAFQRLWNNQRSVNDTIPALSTVAEISAVLDVLGAVPGQGLIRGSNYWAEVAFPAGANPTAIAGPVAVAGVAPTFLRSDGAPAVQTATTGQLGLVEPDGTTITISGGKISAAPQNQPTGANPTAIAGPVAVNGAATTFMRSDGAPAVQTATTGQLGLVEPDGTTITISGGKISAAPQNQPTGANPTATAGPVAVNGVASTFLRSDGAPAVQLATTTQEGLVKPDGTTITISGGVISSVGGGGSLGVLPLVNGDGGGAGLVQDRVGQCIGVPL